MKPKIKTSLERFGFKDIELKTKAHDDIVLDLLDKERMLNVIFTTHPHIRRGEEIIPIDDNITYYTSELNYSKNLFLNFNEVFDTSGGALSIKKFPVDILTTEDELNILREDLDRYSSKNSIDLEDKINMLREEYGLHNNKIQHDYTLAASLKPRIKILSEHPITKGYEEYKTIIGYVDFFVGLKYFSSDYFFTHQNLGKPIEFFIEVKPKITSFGETLRQMKTYMEFTNAWPILVTDTTDELKKAFESQGVQVYQLK